MNFLALFVALGIVLSCFTLAGLLCLWVNFVHDRVHNVFKQVILILTPVATALTIVIYSSLTATN